MPGFLELQSAAGVLIPERIGHQCTAQDTKTPDDF
jgi:hypothetical protein